MLDTKECLLTASEDASSHAPTLNWTPYCVRVLSHIIACYRVFSCVVACYHVIAPELVRYHETKHVTPQNMCEDIETHVIARKHVR